MNSFIKYFIVIIYLASATFLQGNSSFKGWIFLESASDTLELYSSLPENVNIRYYSRGLEAVSFSIPESLQIETILNEIQSLQGVKHIQSMKKLRPSLPVEMTPSLEKVTVDSLYGYMYDQLNSLGIIQLHQSGLSGKGVKIGMIDSGFKKDLEVFKHILDSGRLLGEKDFVYNDLNTADEDDEGTSGSSQTHGTGTWSIISAYLPGKLVGGAYQASFAIAKTEDIKQEIPAEEDHYVAGIEWFESLEIDIVSSSLAYKEFDDTTYSYDYSELDGQTSVVAQICNWATDQEMIIVTAMGNEETGSGYSIWSPADSPGVLSIGAVNTGGNVSSFSGRGPTADGRIKPDVAALGEGVYMATTNDTYSFRSAAGTSFSTPLIACGVALLKELHPEWQLADFLNAFENQSVLPEKNNDTGWGVPNFYNIAKDNPPVKNTFIPIKIYPNPINDKLNAEWFDSNSQEYVYIYNILGQQVAKIKSEAISDDIFKKHSLSLSLNHYASGIYFIKTAASTGKFIKL